MVAFALWFHPVRSVQIPSPRARTMRPRSRLRTQRRLNQTVGWWRLVSSPMAATLLKNLTAAKTPRNVKENLKFSDAWVGRVTPCAPRSGVPAGPRADLASPSLARRLGGVAPLAAPDAARTLSKFKLGLPLVAFGYLLVRLGRFGSSPLPPTLHKKNLSAEKKVCFGKEKVKKR